MDYNFVVPTPMIYCGRDPNISGRLNYLYSDEFS